jgi:hypothetical protein
MLDHESLRLRRPKLVARLVLSLAVAGLAAGIAGVGPAQSHHGSFSCTDDCAKVPVLFDPQISSAARPSDAQPSEEWEGSAPVPDPLGLGGAADIREFTVLPGNDSLTVEITWDPGFALSYDLDLFIDRQDASGAWTEVGSSTNGQSLGEGDPVELAVVQAPAVGIYRTRVVNFASEQFDYHGTLWFTAAVKPKGGGGSKPSGGRATEDRPDIDEGSKIHVIYFVPSDAQDTQLDTNGVLEASVASMNTFLQADIGRQLRLDNYLDRRTPRLDVSFVRGELTASEYSQTDHPDGAFGAVTEELEHRGWTAGGAVKRYFVYYEGPAESANTCGTAYLNIAGGFAQWSVVWLGSSPGCGARDFGTPEIGGGMSEAIALHENFHNEGMVPLGALHQCYAFQFHLCSAAAGAAISSLDPENIDLLFPFVTFPLRDKVVDRDHDDYYDHPFLHRDMADSPFWAG